MRSPPTLASTGSASGSSKSTEATVAASTIVTLISQTAHDGHGFGRRFPAELLRAFPELREREPAPVSRRGARPAFDPVCRRLGLGDARRLVQRVVQYRHQFALQRTVARRCTRAEFLCDAFGD